MVEVELLLRKAVNENYRTGRIRIVCLAPFNP